MPQATCLAEADFPTLEEFLDSGGDVVEAIGGRWRVFREGLADGFMPPERLDHWIAYCRWGVLDELNAIATDGVNEMGHPGSITFARFMAWEADALEDKRLARRVVALLPQYGDPKLGVVKRRNAPHAEPAGTTLGPLVTKYVAGRMRRGEITAETAKAFRNHLWTFARSFGRRRLQQLGPGAVDIWLEQIADLAPSTRALRLSTLRNFARWMVDENVVAKDFTRRAPRIRRVRLVSRSMGLDEFHKVLGFCGDSRERAIMWLWFGLGLRCVEVARLQVDDWDTQRDVLYVIGKALHERELPVPPPVRAALSSYLSECPATVGDPLIRSQLDSRAGVSASRISNIGSGLIKRAGIKSRPFDGISSHGWRGAAASDLLDTGCDLRVVQEFLGHQNIATTSAYLRSLGVAKIREALDARTWELTDEESEER